MQMNIFLKDKPFSFEEKYVITGKEKPTTVIFDRELSVKPGYILWRMGGEVEIIEYPRQHI